MSRLKTHYTWPHVFRQPILFIPKFQYRKGVSTTRLEWILVQSPSICQSHSRMASIMTVSQRIIFFPRQTVHASRTVDMQTTTKVVTSCRQVPLAWSIVMSVINNGWSRWTPTLTLLSLTLFCQIMMRQRHSMETRTTTSCCMLKSLVQRWALMGLPHISQITTPITLIVITCDCWSFFLAPSYKLCSELALELLVPNLPYAHPMLIPSSLSWFLYSSCLCSRVLILRGSLHFFFLQGKEIRSTNFSSFLSQVVAMLVPCEALISCSIEFHLTL